MAFVGRSDAQIKVGVSHDAEQPRGETRFVAEGVQVFVQAKEYLPRDVAGLFMVAAQRVSELVHRLFVAANQQIPCGGVAGFAFFKQSGLAHQREVCADSE